MNRTHNLVIVLYERAISTVADELELIEKYWRTAKGNKALTGTRRMPFVVIEFRYLIRWN